MRSTTFGHVARRGFLGLALAWSLGFVAVHAAERDALAAVRQADDERVAATIAGDRDRLALLYSDDLRYAHSSGLIDDKAEHLALLAQRKTTYAKFDYQRRDFRLVVAGVVLMSGRVLIHSSNAKGPQVNDANFLAVWRLESGRWRLLDWQASKNPAAEKSNPAGAAK